MQDRHTLPAPAGLDFKECNIKSETSYATLWVVTFNPKMHAFAVMDNPEGAYDLGTAAEKRGALAAVNGGYFHPDHTPLGLLVRQGVEIHPIEHASLLSGILSVTPAAITIQRTAVFKSSPAIREALQAGPFLVDHSSPITGLNETKEAARTVVFQDAKGHFGLLIAKSTSLAGMAEILMTPAIFPEGRILRALNLDGGTSTALWVRSSPPFYAHEWKGVRDYLAIVPR
jgi:uncharacterized protein YigE (DUF2233 family)